MAFKTAYTHNGFTYNEAYIKAYMLLCDAKQMTVGLDIYPNEQCRKDNFAPLLRDSRVFEAQIGNWTGNPLENAYDKLQASGEFPNAVWNI